MMMLLLLLRHASAGTTCSSTQSSAECHRGRKLSQTRHRQCTQPPQQLQLQQQCRAHHSQMSQMDVRSSDVFLCHLPSASCWQRLRLRGARVILPAAEAAFIPAEPGIASARCQARRVLLYHSTTAGEMQQPCPHTYQLQMTAGAVAAQHPLFFRCCLFCTALYRTMLLLSCPTCIQNTPAVSINHLLYA